MSIAFESGVLALVKNDAHEALECFRRHLADSPRDATAHWHCGQAYLLLKDRVRALASMNAAIKLETKSAWRAERAALLFKQRSWAAAIEDCEADVTRGDLLALRARCRAALGDSAAALADYTAAIALGEPCAAERDLLLAELRGYAALDEPPASG